MKKQIWENVPQDVGIIVFCKSYVDKWVMRYVNSRADALEKQMARLTNEMKQVLFKVADLHNLTRKKNESDDAFVSRIKHFVQNDVKPPQVQVISIKLKDGSEARYTGPVQIVQGYTPDIAGMEMFEVDVVSEDLFRKVNAEIDEHKNRPKKTKKALTKKTAKKASARAKKRVPRGK